MYVCVCGINFGTFGLPLSPVRGRRLSDHFHFHLTGEAGKMLNCFLKLINFSHPLLSLLFSCPADLASILTTETKPNSSVCRFKLY